MTRSIILVLGSLYLPSGLLGCGHGETAAEAVSTVAGGVSGAAETALQGAPNSITVDLQEENESGQSSMNFSTSFSNRVSMLTSLPTRRPSRKSSRCIGALEIGQISKFGWTHDGPRSGSSAAAA